MLALRVLADGEARTLQHIARATGRCMRLTRATIKGCIVAGLCEPEPGAVPMRVRITAEGRDLLEKSAD